MLKASHWWACVRVGGMWRGSWRGKQKAKVETVCQASASKAANERVGSGKEEEAGNGSGALRELVMAKAASGFALIISNTNWVKQDLCPISYKTEVYPNMLLGHLHAGEVLPESPTSHLNSCVESQWCHLGGKVPSATSMVVLPSHRW